MKGKLSNISKSISSERIGWLALFIILVLAGSLRYGMLDVPLERDEGEYAYAGQLMLNGIAPYQEVYNMKFPGIYAAYSVFLALFGHSHYGIHTGLLIINLITTTIIFFLARQISGVLGAVASAAGFTLLSVSQPVQGVYANSEHFVILFATGGLLLLLKGLDSASMLRIFTSGVLLSVGFLMKQHGFAFVLFATMYIILISYKKSTDQRSRLLRRLFFFISGVLLPIGLLILMLLWTGVFETFVFWTFGYALSYISQVPFALGWLLFSTTVLIIVKAAPLIWLFAGIGLLSLVTKGISKNHRIFMFGYVIFSLMSISPGLYFRHHYFVLLLPCASLLLGIGVNVFSDALSRERSNGMKYGLPILLTCICIAQSIYIQRDYLLYMTPFQISRSTYGLNPFPESLKLADFIKEHTSKEDRIGILGSEPQIFFYSQRKSASSYIYMYPLMESHDFALQMQKNFINDIETANIAYLIYVGVYTSWLQRQDSHFEIFKWADEYLKSDRFKLVGIVELQEDKAVYHWAPDVKWPAPYEYSLAVFKRVK